IAVRTCCVGIIFDALRIDPSSVELVLVSEVDRVMQWAEPAFARDLINLLSTAIPVPGSRSTSSLTLLASASSNPNATSSITSNSLATTSTSTAISGLPSEGPRLRVARGGVTSHPVTSSESALGLDDRRRQIVEGVIQQINCLLEYREFMNHQSKMSSMLAIHNLKIFYESIKRKDMTMRYLYKLERLHNECGNKIERGYTLQMIGEHYTVAILSIRSSSFYTYFMLVLPNYF
ncbi:unnamed protein product, partial [Protopolystoma xenopodis]